MFSSIGKKSVAKKSNVTDFNETTIILFIIWSIVLFLMFNHARDVEYGFQPAHLIVEVHSYNWE